MLSIRFCVMTQHASHKKMMYGADVDPSITICKFSNPVLQSTPGTQDSCIVGLAIIPALSPAPPVMVTPAWFCTLQELSLLSPIENASPAGRPVFRSLIPYPILNICIYIGTVIVGSRLIRNKVCTPLRTCVKESAMFVDPVSVAFGSFNRPGTVVTDI